MVVGPTTTDQCGHIPAKGVFSKGKACLSSAPKLYSGIKWSVNAIKLSEIVKIILVLHLNAMDTHHECCNRAIMIHHATGLPHE